MGNYPSNANAGELNKWISLSIHWNVPDGAEGSYVYCNGKNIGNFTAVNRIGFNYLAFGDINTSGVVNLDDDIALFAVYKEFKMTESDIKLHHYVFCSKWYNIDHYTITLWCRSSGAASLSRHIHK